MLQGVLEHDMAPRAGVRTGGETTIHTLLLLAVHIENEIIRQLLLVLKQSSHFLLMPR